MFVCAVACSSICFSSKCVAAHLSRESARRAHRSLSLCPRVRSLRLRGHSRSELVRGGCGNPAGLVAVAALLVFVSVSRTCRWRARSTSRATWRAASRRWYQSSLRSAKQHFSIDNPGFLLGHGVVVAATGCCMTMWPPSPRSAPLGRSRASDLVNAFDVEQMRK